MPGRRVFAGLLVAIVAAFAIAGLWHRASTFCSAGAAVGQSSRLTPDRGLAARLEAGPCAPHATVVYNLRDDHGSPMAVLDPIADPDGGYLGVYHTLVRANPDPGRSSYAVFLAHSEDLVHWRRLAILDPSGAAMPTLRAVPGGPGFLLAYEKAVAPAGAHAVRLAYYSSLGQLVRGHPAAARSLPLRYSYNDGTPSFLAIQWGGGLYASAIALGFHYQESRAPLSGQDREAVGVLWGFHQWDTQRDDRTDRLIDAAGLDGSHGDERQFSYAGKVWRVYEASEPTGGFGTWHVLLASMPSGQAIPLTFETAEGRFATSFGNPIVSVLPAPRGPDPILVTTLFVFSSGPAAREAGELLFYGRA